MQAISIFTGNPPWEYSMFFYLIMFMTSYSLLIFVHDFIFFTYIFKSSCLYPDKGYFCWDWSMTIYIIKSLFGHMISEGESIMRDGDFLIADAVNRKLTDHIFKVKSSPVPSDIVPLLRLYFLLVPSLHKEHHYLGASVQIL